jgi:hypothetical protein
VFAVETRLKNVAGLVDDLDKFYDQTRKITASLDKTGEKGVEVYRIDMTVILCHPV